MAVFVPRLLSPPPINSPPIPPAQTLMDRRNSTRHRMSLVTRMGRRADYRVALIKNAGWCKWRDARKLISRRLYGGRWSILVRFFGSFYVNTRPGFVARKKLFKEGEGGRRKNKKYRKIFLKLDRFVFFLFPVLSLYNYRKHF